MKEALYYNALAVTLAGDYGKLAKLKSRFGNWESAYENLKRGGGAPKNAEAELEKMQSACVRLVLPHENDYPPLLTEIPTAPFGIYLRGSLPKKGAVLFSIVGTRRATPEGKSVAGRFARELTQAGFAIVSGLAFGIDATAHEGCLDAGGTTVAVLAGGLNAVYPRENEKLAEKILAGGGAIISEYPLGSPPYPERFLQRNRIISGLSRGTLIVEAPKGSGSLATARHALEQDRDVFAVPGSVSHPNFAGSHELIRQGAELVTAPEEILEAYGITREEKISAQTANASGEERQILEALQKISGPASVDKIIAATTLEPHIVNRALAFLILKNIVKEAGGGYTI